MLHSTRRNDSGQFRTGMYALNMKNATFNGTGSFLCKSLKSELCIGNQAKPLWKYILRSSSENTKSFTYAYLVQGKECRENWTDAKSDCEVTICRIFWIEYKHRWSNQRQLKETSCSISVRLTNYSFSIVNFHNMWNRKFPICNFSFLWYYEGKFIVNCTLYNLSVLVFTKIISTYESKFNSQTILL